MDRKGCDQAPSIFVPSTQWQLAGYLRHAWSSTTDTELDSSLSLTPPLGSLSLGFLPSSSLLRSPSRQTQSWPVCVISLIFSLSLPLSFRACWAWDRVLILSSQTVLGPGIVLPRDQWEQTQKGWGGGITGEHWFWGSISVIQSRKGGLWEDTG